MSDVHTTHCCILHGCKYDDEDCTVTSGVALQEYLCEYCHEEGITSLGQLSRINQNSRVLDEALNIIEALISEEDCRFDHKGDCQEHGWFNLRVNNEKCPHEEARELLARIRGN